MDLGTASVSGCIASSLPPLPTRSPVPSSLPARPPLTGAPGARRPVLPGPGQLHSPLTRPPARAAPRLSRACPLSRPPLRLRPAPVPHGLPPCLPPCKRRCRPGFRSGPRLLPLRPSPRAASQTAVAAVAAVQSLPTLFSGWDFCSECCCVSVFLPCARRVSQRPLRSIFVSSS